MIKPKQNREKNSKRQSLKHLSNRKTPKLNKPAAISRRRSKGDTRRQSIDIDRGHATNMHEARKEDEGERRAVVTQKDADGVSKQGAVAHHARHVAKDEDEQGDDGGQVKGLAVAQAAEHLDALLQVDEGDVAAENVAGEARHPPQPVARVGHGQGPVEDEGPSEQSARVHRVFSDLTYKPIQAMNCR